jgi:chemotaxis protein methyltransferase CheR
MAPHNNITDSQYQAFKQFLQTQCGILLGDKKQYLVRSRLLPIVKHSQFSNVGELIKGVLSSYNASLVNQVIEAMTTNETFWFRDSYPFAILQDTLFQTFISSQRKLRIWSAACSSGQEPYSIAMSALEFESKSQQSLELDILGTDISAQMIEQSLAGRYDNLALGRGLSPERRKQFFTEFGEKGQMQLNQDVKKRVSFQTFNLLSSFEGLGKFDIIFCRNVLIYFSADMKKQILQQIAACLDSGGILFLGASESLNGASQQFDFVRSSTGLYYVKT